MTEKTHVYVSVEFAKQIEAAANDTILQEQVINDIIQSKKKLFHGEMELLDEQVLVFKQFCVVHRNRLKEVYDDERDKLESLIDDVMELQPSVRDSAIKLAAQLNPLRVEVAEITSAIKQLEQLFTSINTYRIKDTLEVLERLAQLDEPTRQLILGLNSSK